MPGRPCKIPECSHHRAKLPDTDEKARYCKRHLCQTRSCGKKKTLSHHHCPTHKCIDPSCPDGRALRSLYCTKHSKCGVPECPVIQNLSREVSLPAYCRSHTCATTGCMRPTIQIGGLCRQCWLFQSQTPRCQRCGRPDTINHLCPVQCCQWPQCSRPVRKSGRCEQHQPCLFEGCTKSADRRASDGAVYQHCDSHDFCPYDGGRRLKEASKLCCTQCACDKRGCNQPKDRFNDRDNRWCRVHTCERHGCHAATMNDADEKKFRYCQRHNCAKPDCTSEAAVRGIYCKAHTCSSAAGCLIAPVGNGHKFCAGHECKEAECFFEARLPGGYCSHAANGVGHACQEPGCPEKAGGWTDRAYNRLCGNHAISTARNDGYRSREEDEEEEGRVPGRGARTRRNSPRPMPGVWRSFW